MTIPELITALHVHQLPDGGWGYGGSAACTEPTAWAILALRAAADKTTGLAKAETWLRKTQRSDGGWAPRPEVDISTWVSSLGLLALPGNLPAWQWLMAQTGRDSRLTQRVREWMLGVTSEYDSADAAWSWYPETASWVGPTAYAILALRGAKRPEAADRIAAGQRFLVSRRCRDGGWNHGSARALGYEAHSYPEMTGLALSALAGTKHAESAKSNALVQLPECRTAEGVAWLQLGLAAVGVRPLRAEVPACRSAHDLALRLLSEVALAGRYPFAPSPVGRARP